MYNDMNDYIRRICRRVGEVHLLIKIRSTLLDNNRFSIRFIQRIWGEDLFRGCGFLHAINLRFSLALKTISHVFH